MYFQLSNQHADLKGKVRLSIDTSHELALEILEAAVEIAKDPNLDAVKAALAATQGSWIKKNQ